MREIRFGVSIDQDRYGWDEMVANARAVEEAGGFDSIWVYDHLVGPERPGSRAAGRVEYRPAAEAWTLLAGLAASTSRVRLGVKVSGATYRHPSMLAKQAVTVDQISHGRLVLGMGAGWHEDEHRMYGIPFPSLRERVDRFAESVEIVDRLMRGDRTTFHGRYFQLDDAPFEPRPVQRPRVPILIGTLGSRMMRVVARYADMLDLSLAEDGDVRRLIELLRTSCHEIGRDPASVRISTEASAAHTASDAAFRDFVNRHLRLGFTDFFMEFPRVDPADRLRHLARRVLPELGASPNPR